MDHWLRNAPALIYVKDLSTWLVVNHKCAPILWTQDNSEVAWYLACLECSGNERAKIRLVKNSRRKPSAQDPNRITPQREKRKPAVVIPLRVP